MENKYILVNMTENNRENKIYTTGNETRPRIDKEKLKQLQATNSLALL